ncbi:S8 family serine peptidase [Candidatus Nitrospira salsa]
MKQKLLLTARRMVVLIVLALVNVFSPLYAQNSESTPRFVPGEVIVKMKPSGDAEAMTRSIFGVERSRKTTSGGEIIIKVNPTMRQQFSAAQMIDETLALVEELNQRPDVEYAQPNYILERQIIPNDSRYGEQWHYFMNGSKDDESPGGIGLPEAWDVTKGSPDIVITVIDTGILPEHPDIAGSPNLIPGYDMISDPFMANDEDGRDADPTDAGDAIQAFECGNGPPQDRGNSWHGTHVAGTVGVGITDNSLGIAGVNWNTKVQAVRVLGKCGGTTADIIDAIRWAAGLNVPDAPQNDTPAKVINMSLGAAGVNCPTQDQATQSAIRDAVLAGTTVVVAAGNDAIDASQATPASCHDVITVAASDPRGHLVSRYSNFGQTVDILAPGGDRAGGDADAVLSTVEGGYAFYNGTSMAAPHVAGVAALILSENPDMLPGQVEARLKHDALPRNDIQCPKACGAGLLQAKFHLSSEKADLGVQVVVSPEMVKVDDTLTYSVTITNHGPGEATGVMLMNTLPQEVELISKEFNHGTCTEDSVVTCDVSPLPNGFHARLTMVVKTDMAGSITNHTEVKGDLPDENMSNNIASAITIVDDNGVPPPTEIPIAPPSTKGELTEFRQMDIYQMKVETQGEYKLETAGDTDVMMTLYGPNNKHVRVAQDLDGGDGSNAKIVQSLEEGMYFMEVRHQSIFGMGKYEISVQQLN